MRYQLSRRFGLICTALAVAAVTTASPRDAGAAETTVRTVNCTAADAMSGLRNGIEGQTFPTGGTRADGGPDPGPAATSAPDSVLTVATVRITTRVTETKPDSADPASTDKKSPADQKAEIEKSCAATRDIRVRLRVAVLNVSPDPAFITQNAKVVCGLYATGVPGLAGGLDKANVKLSSMTWQFFFERVRHGEQGLSFISTGTADDPTSVVTIEGDATSDHFVKGAHLGGCVTRFNE